MEPRERGAWVLLNSVQGVGPVRFGALLQVCGTAEAAIRATTAEMAAAGFDRRSAEALRSSARAQSPEASLERLERIGARALTLLDPDYPAPLRHIADPPPVLFIRGSLEPRDQCAVGIVGTRRVTPYGRAVAERLSRDLAMAGATVVSGLAKGVDTIAHRAALDAGGRTVAVLGNGLDQVYPPENAVLARRIAQEGSGALVSEFAPGVPPDAANFPRRNRIISGLSGGVVVVEAGQRSGALITADFALEQGREVFAVPGSILSAMSAGSNNLLKQGATPVVSAVDILDALGYVPAGAAVEARPVQHLAGIEQAVAEALRAEARGVDEIAVALGRAAGEVAAALTMLELKGFARHMGSQAYVRC
ncbi:MAG: DNA-protecting protein DprA [Chloroflexi bacterium]|nr:DNA-protecting protein DprA [Chloroflexota bacterium]